jgi:CheY-like chemotaxis protein
VDLIDILLVEDREADIELTRMGLAEGRIANALHVVRDGVEALAYLRRQGRYAEAKRPDLILLDLNLPRMDGREVLTAIKADPDLKLVPVVVLTTSEADRDVVEAYTRHANAYMIKPVDFDQLVKVIRGITEYWFALVKLPPRR